MEPAAEMPEWVAQKASHEYTTRKYPFATMKLYQTFTVLPGYIPKDGWKGIKQCARKQIKEHGKQFVHRKWPDGTIEVCRVK